MIHADLVEAAVEGQDRIEVLEAYRAKALADGKKLDEAWFERWWSTVAPLRRHFRRNRAVQNGVSHFVRWT